MLKAQFRSKEQFKIQTPTRYIDHIFYVQTL